MPDANEVPLRFVGGRPVGALTIRFLASCCARLAARRETALLLVWDNAAWHVSQTVRAWLRDHNRRVRGGEATVRIVVCRLPIKRPWLNPIEQQWVHGKRRAVAPDHTLTTVEIAERACAALGCAYEPYLTLPLEVA